MAAASGAPAASRVAAPAAPPKPSWQSSAPPPASSSAGGGGGEGVPCGSYAIDVTAAAFGQCKCGFAKKDHGGGYVAKASVQVNKNNDKNHEPAGL
jgi:hypothetical protein